MNKRLQIGLAPLLAIAALAVVGASAQAFPHIYQNGVVAAEAKKVHEIWWGTLHMKSAMSGVIECHAIAAASEENPTGGAPAIGTVQGFVPYECASESCTLLGGKGIKLNAGKLPWSTADSEAEAGVFRKEIGGPPELKTECEGVATHGFSEGGMAPRIQNDGKSIGAAPDELTFEEGEPSKLKNGTESLEIAASLKFEGYGAQELIAVKNP